MQIRVSHVKNKLVFEFSSEARFDVLVVSNVEDHVFWELKPAYLQPASVVSTFAVSIRVPSRLVGAITEGQTTSAEAGVPMVARVVYGEAPAGYRELTSAQPLRTGERYSLLFFDDSGHSGGVTFTA